MLKPFLYVAKRGAKRIEKAIGRCPDVSLMETKQVYNLLVSEVSQKRQQRVTPVGELPLPNAYRLFEKNMKGEGKSERALYLYENGDL